MSAANKNIGELVLKTVTLKHKLINRIIDVLKKHGYSKTFRGTIALCFFNTTLLYNILKDEFPLAKLYIIEDKTMQGFIRGISQDYIFYTDLNKGEFIDMDFDLIIANPPYGKIGANITKKIIDTVNFKEYINLLPANDYKRNDTKDLFNYQSDMVNVNDGFSDAAVTTHLARIHKTKVNSLTLDEFKISQRIDRSLDKYFIETVKRKYEAFENNDQGNHPERWSNDKTVIMGFKDSANGHMPYSKNCNTYKWNVEKSIDSAWIIANCNYYAKAGRGLRVPFVGFTFGTEVEHNNFIKFFYSDKGFKFMSKVITALNADSWVGTEEYMPKVDWTRSWTVEEILADYGYSQDEIKEVIDDLVNYKGMED